MGRKIDQCFFGEVTEFNLLVLQVVSSERGRRFCRFGNTVFVVDFFHALVQICDF